MQYHNLKRTTKNKKARQVGRGGKRGKTSGKGTKGQKARAGRKIRPEIRDTIKKLPKLRGYAFKSISVKPISVSFDLISKKFDDGSSVTIESLIEKKIVSLSSGKSPKVKIVGGKGDTLSAKKLNISGIKVTTSVREAVEKAGGEIK